MTSFEGAPGATIIPLRVAGWQRDAAGDWAVYGRTDQLIAGLERAVDPNGDGDAHDAARIALVGVVEPFAAFADGPAAEAVTGASALDTLVVVPGGNDGPAGPGFGSVSGPGGAPEALTVAAADLRRATARVPLAVRAGVEVLVDEAVPLVSPVGPSEDLRFALRRYSAGASPAGRRRRRRRRSGTSSPRRAHPSRPARPRSCLPGLRPGSRSATRRWPARTRCSSTGSVPAGALGLDEDLAVPVVGLPPEVAQRARSRPRGAAVTVSIGRAEVSTAIPGGRIADFSSRGLAFDGRVKPEVSAPGVALPTAEPGTHEDGSPRIGTINGSSAAAAAVAGAAALLAQGRPATRPP